jgi:hypothetical protein
MDEEVERIAAAWVVQPCPPDEAQWCDPECHVWENMDEGDKDYHRQFVAFVIKEAMK